MRRGRFTAAILPILAGAAAAVIIGNVPTPSYSSPVPLGSSIQATWVMVGCPAGPRSHPSRTVLACHNRQSQSSGPLTTYTSVAFRPVPRPHAGPSRPLPPANTAHGYLSVAFRG